MGSCFEDIEGIDSEVELYGTPEIVDEGIGPYECHGSKGFHHDHQARLDKIQWDRRLYTPDENETIARYVEQAETHITEKIIESHDFERDYPEGEDE
ncbi:MAG: hypothetical protein HQK96_03775 [Nitrospirae bacterium]|nr:hypothetical protein [Nitrospirota bacterium]